MMLIDPYVFGYSLPPAIDYVYYRMTVHNARNGTTIGQVYIPSFEILDSSGTNILTGGTASASAFQVGFGPELAFDGNTSTGFRNVNNNYPFSITYQCPSSVTPYVLRGWFSNIGAWDLEASNDGTNWTVIAREADAGWWNNEFSNPDYYYYHPIAASECWRLRVTSVNSGTQLQIYEFVIKDSIGGSQELTGGYPFASSDNGYSFSNFVDGNISTNFGTYPSNGNTIASGTVWIGYILPLGVTVNAVEVSISAFGLSGAPTGMVLEKSPDGGKNWFFVKNITTTWSGGSVTTQTFSI